MCNAGVFTLTFNTLFAKTILFFPEGFGGYIILMEFQGRGGGGGGLFLCSKIGNSRKEEELA